MAVTDLTRLIDEREAARLLSITPGTLSVWRCVKRYDLPYLKVGRAVRYRLSDIEAFLQSRTIGAAAQ